jgi:metal-responsive CopG/Arc/MetJ family transcriptional regulator
MKQVFTISLDENLAEKIREKTRELHFRNKSHFVEEAILKFLEGKK